MERLTRLAATALTTLIAAGLAGMIAVGIGVPYIEQASQRCAEHEEKVISTFHYYRGGSLPPTFTGEWSDEQSRVWAIFEAWPNLENYTQVEVVGNAAHLIYRFPTGREIGHYRYTINRKKNCPEWKEKEIINSARDIDVRPEAIPYYGMNALSWNVAFEGIGREVDSREEALEHCGFPLPPFPRHDPSLIGDDYRGLNPYAGAEEDPAAAFVEREFARLRAIEGNPGLTTRCANLAYLPLDEAGIITPTIETSCLWKGRKYRVDFRWISILGGASATKASYIVTVNRRNDQWRLTNVRAQKPYAVLTARTL
ncbi:MAG: hypothetical protein WCT32_03160 [Patescibacteria group bacterium]|jgi:hypothetical protein